MTNLADLADLSWPAAAARAEAGAVLLVPVGSTEQHGPHLPLSTDTDVAVALCSRVAARRADVLVAPPLPYGSSGEHAGFAGTLSIGQEATELVLLELGRSAGETFRRVVFVSAHGGNAAPVTRAVRRLQGEGRAASAFFPRWPVAGGTGDAHAGRTETSLQLALDPSRVDLAVAAAGNTEPVEQLMPQLIAGGVRAVSRNGVLGDPAGASAADGAALVAEVAGQLTALLDGGGP